MKSQKMRAFRRVLGLVALLGGLFLTTPAPALACSGGGDYYDCRSFWLDELYYPCLGDCAGLSGPEYRACRSACWEEWKAVSRDDCHDCPY